MALPNNTKQRRSSTFTVELPTLPSFVTQPRAIEVREVQGEHEQVTLTFKYSSHDWFDTLITGTPIKVQWGSTTAFRTWYGYVSFVTRTVSPSGINVMEVKCVGTSFVLKERAARVFRDTTVPDAVQEIVEEFGFNFVGEQDSRVFEQLTMAGHSYWEWIQEQAKRIGFGVLIDGMDFIFKPLDKLIDYGVKSVPIFSFNGFQGLMEGQLYDRTLDTFRVSNGEYVEDANALRTVKRVGGVNPNTAEVITHSESPKDSGVSLRTNVNEVLFSEIRSEQVVHDQKSGVEAAAGAASLARMNTPAKATGQGDANVRPYFPVCITGTGDTTDGFWIVKEAVHVVAGTGEYQIRMTLGVDGKGANRVTEFRPAINSRVGVVDLKQALEVGRNVNASVNSAVRLDVSQLKGSLRGTETHKLSAQWKYAAGRGI